MKIRALNPAYSIDPQERGVVKVGESKKFFAVGYTQYKECGEVAEDFFCYFKSEKRARNFAINVSDGRYGIHYDCAGGEITLEEFYREDIYSAARIIHTEERQPSWQ